MAEGDQAHHQVTPTPERQPRSLPQGYRQGIITAITVLLGFALTFLRFWGGLDHGIGHLASMSSHQRLKRASDLVILRHDDYRARD
jgi:phosphotransferase system  glucose/maltose/N-acetylglucosamine-specific IIC component